MNQLKSKIIFAVVIICVVAVEALHFAFLDDNFLRRQFFDFWTKMNNQDYQQSKIVSIEFDQNSLLEIGYPIGRNSYAMLLKKINEFEPKVVAFDIIFGPSKDSDGTQQLADVMAKSEASLILAASIDDREMIDGPTAPILSSKTQLGIVDGNLDTDGTYRWYPLIHATADGYLPSLGLKAYLVKNDFEFNVVKASDGRINGINILHGKNIKRYIDLTIDPLKIGRMALTPRSRSVDVEKFGWSEILSNDFQAPDNFKNGIFLVGLTVSGVASHQSTAMDPTQLPLHNHLFVLQDLEDERNLKVWPWSNFFLVLWVAFLIIFFVIQRPVSYFLMSLFGIISVVFLLSVSFVLWRNDFLWIPQSETAVLFSGALMAFIRRSSDEERQKNALRKSFSTYLHPSIVKNLMEQSSEVKLGGEERELTLLFSDLRNFTSLSEKVSSKELVSIMNEYFTIVTKHIQESGGTVDKFIGDAVMAFWNAPLTQELHSEKALIAVDKIRKDFGVFSLKWGERLNLKEGISLGIGLHKGKAIVGNIGGDNRFNYTALGDNVNLTSRLEGICKVYSVDIILSLDLINSLSEESRKKWIEIDTIQVKGQSKDVVIFTENNLSEEQSLQWQQMLAAWRLGHREDVKACLPNISKAFGPVNTFNHRLGTLLTFPPHWRGSWRMNEK